MASTGKKGKKNKGKTVPLNDFLSNTTSWSDQVDEADKLGEFNRKPVLPAAPRAARALEIDENRNPPYVAYISNLSYELQDEDIINAFEGQNVINVRLPRDERSGRLKGFGYVEFGDWDSFFAALLKYEATIRGRRIRIDVAESEGDRRRGGGPRDVRNRESSSYESERLDWRSGGSKRSEFSANDDKRGLGSGRKDYGGFRDNYDRGGRNDRGDRTGESNWRDSERRYGGDRDRDSRGYGNRRNFNESETSMEPKTRTKLNLKPRSKPIEEIVIKEEPCLEKSEDRPEHEKPPSTSIFGQAKPVDTAAREREIELRLEKEKEGGKVEKEFDKSKSKDSQDDSSSQGKRPGPTESKEHSWVRGSQRQETQECTSRDSSVGKNDENSETDEVVEEGEKELEEKENTENAAESIRFGESGKKYYDYNSDHDNDNRYGRYNKNETRFNNRNRDGGDKPYGRDDRDRREKERRNYDRRDRGYDSDRRMGNNGGRNRDRDGEFRRFDRNADYKRFDRDGDSRRHDRDGDSRRFDRDGDSRRFDRDGESRRFDRDGESRHFDRDRDSKRFDKDGESKRDGDWRESSDKGDNKRAQDRDVGRHKEQQDDHGANKGLRGDKRIGSGDKGSRPLKITQDREKGSQNKEKPKEQKKTEDGVKLPKFKETTAPNYINANKYSFLDEDGISE